MIEFRKRKIQRINKSLWICLPMEWTKHHNLKKGDKVKVQLGEQDNLIVNPEVLI